MQTLSIYHHKETDISIAL